MRTYFTVFVLFLSMRLFAQLPSGCDWTVTLHDSWHDGWNNNTLLVEINGDTTIITVGTEPTCTNPDSVFVLPDLRNGDTIRIQYLASGSFPGENTWELRNNNGVVVQSDGSAANIGTACGTPASTGPVAGVWNPTLTVGSCPSCNITVNLFDDYGDGWNGGSLDVEINGVITNIFFNGTNCNITGADTSVTFTIQIGDTIRARHNAGAFAVENYWEIVDAGGAIVLSDGSPLNMTASGGSCGTGLGNGAPTSGVWSARYDGTCPQCFPTTVLAATGITATGATLFWNSVSTALHGYRVRVVASGAGPQGTPAFETTTQGMNDTSRTATGLTGLTTYDVWVQARCDSTTGDTSNWAGPVSFTTSAVPVTAFPHCEDFNSLAICDPVFACPGNLVCNPQLAPIGWSQLGSDADDWKIQSGFTASTVWNGGSPVGGGAPIPGNTYFYAETSSGCPTGSQIVLDSRDYTLTSLTGGVRIQYSTYFPFVATGGRILVEIESPPGSGTYVYVDSVIGATTTTGTWVENTVDIPPVVGTANFRITATIPPCCDDLGFDQFCVSAVPTCPAITGLVNVARGADSAKVMWNSSPTALFGYQWRVVASGAGVNSVAIDSGQTSGVNDTMATGFGIAACADVDVYVRPVCAVADSGAWVSVSTGVGAGCNNDWAANAYLIGCGGSATGTTTTATADGGIPTGDCGSGGLTAPGRWYRFVGTGDEITAELCSSLYDTRIDVWCSPNGTADSTQWICAGGNDDDCALTRSRVNFLSVNGQVYYILVHGWNFSSGTYTLDITCNPSCTPPLNDDCQPQASCLSPTSAEALTVYPSGTGVPTGGDNSCAATATFNPTCDAFGEIKDVWYTFTANQATQVIVLTDTTATVTNMAIYSDTCTSNTLNSIYCFDPSSGGTLSIFNPGTTYYIQIWSTTAESGTFSIYVEDPPPCLNAPTDLTAINITQTTATVTWVPGDAVNRVGSYVEYGPAGFTPGTGTLVFVAVPDTHLNIAGLTASTSYDFYVYDTCPSGFQSPSASGNFITDCAVISSFPYSESFEGGPGFWAVGTNNGTSTWALGTPATTNIVGASDGTQAWCTNLTGDYAPDEQSFVQSPCFDFTGFTCDPIIQLDINYHAEDGWDGAILQSSIDGGASWQTVGALADPGNWYSDPNLREITWADPADIGWSGDNVGIPNSGGWITASHELNGLAGQTQVNLRIAFGSDGSIQREGFAFDNVRIMDGDVTHMWFGAVDSDWNTAGNWSCLGVPNAGCPTAMTIIPDVNSNDPSTNGSSINVNNLRIDNGASVDVALGDVLGICGHIWNNGTPDMGLGTLMFNNSTAGTSSANGTIEIEIVALNLTSANPITVNTGSEIRAWDLMIGTQGTLDNTAGGSVVLGSDATRQAQVAVGGAAVFNGPITMERWIDGTWNGGQYDYNGYETGYHYLSAPFGNTDVNEFADFAPFNPTGSACLPSCSFGNLGTFFRMDETFVGSTAPQHYEKWADVTIILPGEGYAAHIRDINPANTTVDFSGTYAHGFPVIRPTSFTVAAGAAGFNLNGNPHPHSHDWDQIWPGQTVNTNPTIWIWEPLTLQYSSYNAATTTSIGSATNIIPAMQGFFTQNTAAGTDNISIQQFLVQMLKEPS